MLLFSVQRFGTGKVGFMFAPILGLWFINLSSIGIYNIVKYDISVVRAFNPVYIYLFFATNGIKAWSALGGCVLCITGASFLQQQHSSLILLSFEERLILHSNLFLFSTFSAFELCYDSTKNAFMREKKSCDENASAVLFYILHQCIL